MGEVWLGVRDDGLFEQSVAIKLMRPSRFSAQAAAFFDIERRALARLNHRHIARLIDGGVTPEGIPWFIMDLVDGAPLDVQAVAGTNASSQRIVLRLMADLADTVQYAHAQLVVHADIKPSNVLIRPSGEPCLVDFGIASLAAAAADSAEESPFPSTPAYASPQRIAGHSPTPSDDIFSLGVLLHGLLSGRWPQAPIRAPLAPTGHSACDGVIQKATAPKLEDRYVTAEAMAADLRAILEQRPTSVQQDDLWLALRLFVRRRPRAVASGALVAIGAAAALVAITQLYVHAESQRRQAEQRFGEVRELAGFLLGDLHDELQQRPGAAALRARTTALGRRYLEQLANVKDAPLEVRRDVAIGYGRVGAAEATTSTNATGEVAKGEAALSVSELRLRELVTAHPQRDDFRRELARTLTWRSGVYLSAHNDPAAASRAIDEALSLYDRVLEHNQADLDAAYGRWNGVLGKADILSAASENKALKALMEQTLAWGKRVPAPVRLRSQRALLEAATENNLGDAAYWLTGSDAGVVHYKKAVALMQAARSQGLTDVRLPARQAYYDYQISASLQENRPLAALAWSNRGKALIDEVRRFDDGVSTRRIAEMNSLQRAAVFSQLGQKKFAVAEAETLVALRRKIAGEGAADVDNQIRLGSGLHTLSKLYDAAGDRASACRAAEESLSIFARLDEPSGVPEHNRRLDVAPQKLFVRNCRERKSAGLLPSRQAVGRLGGT